MSILYKIHVIGSHHILHKYQPLLLNSMISMVLYILTCVLVISSSAIVYMYGYHKFITFMESEKNKEAIQISEGKTAKWMYFPHTAAMCILIALGVCSGPLLYDCTIIYKGSLDGTMLVFVIATVLHLFLWIVIWLVFTIKMTWQFKLRVTVGRAAVHNARSVKLVNDIDLVHANVEKEKGPMLIVEKGKTVAIHDEAAKKLIMQTLVKAAMEPSREEGEDETPCLRGATSSRTLNRQRSNSAMTRVASTSLNKQNDEENPNIENASPRKQAQAHQNVQTNTVQHTNDRLPKESIYATIRKTKKHVEEEDDDKVFPAPREDKPTEAHQSLVI